MKLLSENAPPSYRKTAAFTISQMLGSDKSFAHSELASSIIFSTIHSPFNTRQPSSDDPLELPNEQESQKASLSLSRLLILIANCDPSPKLITNLLSPIVASLYSLLFHLSNQKTSDPRLRENIQGLLSTWGKIVEAKVAVDILWDIVVQGEQTHWKTDLEGNIYPSPSCVPFFIVRLAHLPIYTSTEQQTPLSFLLPKDKNAQEDLDISANLFDLYPDPVHFVSFLKSLDRGDIVSDLFIKILEAYRDQRMKGRTQDPMKYVRRINQPAAYTHRLQGLFTTSRFSCRCRSSYSTTHPRASFANRISCCRSSNKF